MVRWATWLVLLLLTAACSSQPKPQSRQFDAVVSQQPLSGNLPRFASVQAAVDAAPEQGWSILIGPGDYYERVVINTPGITLTGAGQTDTRIWYDRYAGQPVSPGSTETWGTFRTATVEINAADVAIANLTIENGYDYPANQRLPKDHPDPIVGEQAVALKVGDNADRFQAHRLTLLGYQDTLYVQGGRSYFTASDIRGHVDFIFGAGNAVFVNTDIYSRGRVRPHTYTGYVTAPSTLIEQPFGLTFLNCRLLREPDSGDLSVPDGSVPLGRPWHPTTTFPDGRYANPYAVGKTTFINTWMDAHIAAVGWTSMGGTAKDGSRKQFDPLTEARFAEYNSQGPGAAVNASRPQLSEQQAQQYQLDRILMGWQPKELTALIDAAAARF